MDTNKSNFIVHSYPKNVQTNSSKFLGITIDKNSNYWKHINNISSKISKKVGVLYRLNFSHPFDILKVLYNCLILPYLTYGIETWYGVP